MRLCILSQTTLDLEKERIQNECSQADIDFEFVIDSSSSIGTGNWQTTMDYIAQYWIQGKNKNTFPNTTFTNTSQNSHFTFRFMK